MHDAPPPYPGINPSYTPSYPPQANGFAGAQPPQMGFAGPQPPQMGFAGAAPPGYPGPATASGSAGYPNLPQNGFQTGPSAPPSTSKFSFPDKF